MTRYMVLFDNLIKYSCSTNTLYELGQLKNYIVVPKLYSSVNTLIQTISFL